MLSSQLPMNDITIFTLIHESLVIPPENKPSFFVIVTNDPTNQPQFSKNNNN